MKKRVEKVVECVDSFKTLTIGNKYIPYSESESYYIIMNDEGDICSFAKERFKEVTQRVVLEFEGEHIDNFEDIFDVRVFSDIDLTNYDIKVIATPKDKTYEDMSKEELIKLLKAKE